MKRRRHKQVLCQFLGGLRSDRSFPAGGIFIPDVGTPGSRIFSLDIESPLVDASGGGKFDAPHVIDFNGALKGNKLFTFDDAGRHLNGAKP